MGKNTPLDTLECWDESSASCGHQVTRSVPHELQGTVVRSESVRHEQCLNPGAHLGAVYAASRGGFPTAEPVSSFSRGQEPPGKNPLARTPWQEPLVGPSAVRHPLACRVFHPPGHAPVGPLGTARFLLVLILIVFIVVETSINHHRATQPARLHLDLPLHRHRPRPPPRPPPPREAMQL